MGYSCQKGVFPGPWPGVMGEVKKGDIYSFIQENRALHILGFLVH